MKPTNNAKRRAARLRPTRKTSADFLRWLGEKQAQKNQPAEIKVGPATPAQVDE